MMFDTFKIKNKELSKYVQYILFNYSSNPLHARKITSFANTNICLGITKDSQVYSSVDGLKTTQQKPGIYSYLSAMYLPPHEFKLAGVLDEICIDFTPLGFYHFFAFPVRTYIFNEDVLAEAFGKESKCFFESVFSTSDYQYRGAMIEAFLLSNMKTYENSFLKESIYHIHTNPENISLKQLSKLQKCSEKKIVRSFMCNLDLSPKDYMRIVKFRKALNALHHLPEQSLTSISHQYGYYDQSHFIKEMKFFTGAIPKQLRMNLYNVKRDVIIAVE
jgi:AraC-like DNA-binding protein